MYFVKIQLVVLALVFASDLALASDVFIPDGFLSARRELQRGDLSEEARNKSEKLLRNMPVAEGDYVVDALFKPLGKSTSEGLVIVDQEGLDDSGVAGLFDSVAKANQRAALALKSDVVPEIRVDERYFVSYGIHRMDIANPFGKTTFMMSYLVIPKGQRQLLVIITAPDAHSPSYDEILSSLK